MECELTLVFEDETRHQLTYVEERVVTAWAPCPSRAGR
jgi:hypothetical protein